MAKRHRTSRVEAEAWRRRVDEAGDQPGVIAAEAGLRARVVEDAIQRARTLHDVRRAQQQQLANALEAHQRELLREADRLRRTACWPPVPPVLGGSLEGKRHQALLSHEKGLQPSIQAWARIATEHVQLMQAVAADVDEALRGDPLELRGGARLRLLEVAEVMGRGHPPGSLPYSVAGGVLTCGAYSLLDGVAALDDQRAVAARRRLEKLTKEVSASEEVEALRKLHRRWEAVQRNLVDALEDIALRRLPAGHCRWCPGTLPIRAKPLPSR